MIVENFTYLLPSNDVREVLFPIRWPASCISSGKLLNHFVPQFPFLYKWILIWYLHASIMKLFDLVYVEM